jgi:hypothetical protein
MVMVLPFAMGLVCALFAMSGRRNAALGLGLATVGIQLWWLVYHSTDKLQIAL